MAVHAMEIAGLVVIAVACIMQISAVGTLKWQTYETTIHGVAVSADFGLFKACGKSEEVEVCVDLTKVDQNKGRKL